MTDPAVSEPTPRPASGRTRLGSYAICLDREDRILLCRLASNEPEPGAWTLPGGGVDFGEHPDDAVVRELREESGLTGRIAEVEGVFSHLYPGSPYASGADLHFLGVLYRVEVTGGRLTDEVDGSTDRCGWFGRDEVAQLKLVSVARHAIGLVWPGALRMKSAISIDVAAPPEVVFALARDVERWPRLLPHYEDVRILERRPDGSVVARMIARRPVFGLLGLGLPVAWRSRTWSEPRDVPDPVRPPGRRDERDGRHVADRGDRGRLPGHDRARLPAAVRAVGTVHRPVLHPPDRRTDARHVQGDRGGGGERRSRARDGGVREPQLASDEGRGLRELATSRIA